jgi:DNA-binding NarL/FixJ family response regulator
VPRVRAIHARDDRFGVEQGAGDPARIAIVEDDYLVASQVEAALAEAGFEVCGIASSADAGVELARTERPALMVMDIRLSGRRDGIDAALELFAAYGIRCIFATAHHDAQVRDRAQPARPLAWLAKPYTMPFLIATVRAAVRELHQND